MSRRYAANFLLNTSPSLFDPCAYTDTSRWDPLDETLLSADEAFELLHPELATGTVEVSRTNPQQALASAIDALDIGEQARHRRLSRRQEPSPRPGPGNWCSNIVQQPMVGASQPIRRRVETGTPTRRSPRSSPR